MAEIKEKEKREERSAPFTDADYIPRSEAPKMPRVFSNADMAEPSAPEKRSVPVTMAVMLCMAFFFLGLWLGGKRVQTTLPAAVAASVPVSGESGSPAVSAPPYTGTRRDIFGNSARLGVAVQTVSAAAAEYYDLYYEDKALAGVQVYAVGDESAAKEAGILPGDILLALDGKAVPSAEALSEAESRYRGGQSAVFTIFRDGKLLEVPVVFDSRDEGDKTAGLDW